MRFSFVVFTAGALALVGCDVPAPGPGPAVLSPYEDFNRNAGLTPIGPSAATAASVVQTPPPGARGPSDSEAAAFARAFFDQIQRPSIRDRVEYCGYFYVTANGEIAATPPRRGTFASCNMPGPEPGSGVFASYHTHGAFGRNYDNEVPSVTDLLSDFDFRIDGYVSTPGGRVWHVDYGSRSTSQICGLGCVYQDPGFQPVDEGSVRVRYSVPQLGQRANSF